MQFLSGLTDCVQCLKSVLIVDACFSSCLRLWGVFGAELVDWLPGGVGVLTLELYIKLSKHSFWIEWNQASCWKAVFDGIYYLP